MNGLELAQAYFEEFGKNMISDSFGEISEKIAVGLVGSGSECFGFDDDISHDHDYEPGFCIFLPGEELIDRKQEFQLERAYAKLPKTFYGFTRSPISPVGGNRHGVLRTADFYLSKCGSSDGNLAAEQWLSVPDYALAEAVNGIVFSDPYGEFSEIRKRLSYYPEDIFLKKLAGQILRMEQSGQYNFLRCIAHRESGAAQLAAAEFVDAALHTVFLLNRTYMPYYKWSFRALRGLKVLSSLEPSLEYLISTGNSDNLPAEKASVIEEIAAAVIQELQNQNLTNAVCLDLEKHAYSVNDHIHDAGIRNLNIFAGV